MVPVFCWRRMVGFLPTPPSPPEWDDVGYWTYRLPTISDDTVTFHTVQNRYGTALALDADVPEDDTSVFDVIGFIPFNPDKGQR